MIDLFEDVNVTTERVRVLNRKIIDIGDVIYVRQTHFGRWRDETEIVPAIVVDIDDWSREINVIGHGFRDNFRNVVRKMPAKRGVIPFHEVERVVVKIVRTKEAVFTND